jgi:hypothetical protein
MLLAHVTGALVRMTSLIIFDYSIQIVYLRICAHTNWVCGLEWINLQILWPRIAMMKQYLPQRVFSKLERTIWKRNPTKKQFDKISSIGKSIGLQRKEIVAATSLPIGHIASGGRNKISFFGVFMIIVIIACISFGLTLLMSSGYFDSSPTFTYAPGTKYGSINPNDFTDNV